LNEIILIIGLIALLLLVFFYFIEPRIIKMKVKNDNEYGSARFATKKEIDKTFSKEEISNIKEVGFPIWYSKDNKFVWFDKETPHWCFLGSTGSGKSVTAVIPMCSFIATAKTKRSVFITDPKGEIYHTTSKMFKDNSYNIITIDFRNPQLSNKINLLEPIIKEYDNYIKYDKVATELENDINYLNSCIESLKEDIELMKSQNIDIQGRDKEIIEKQKQLDEINPKLIENRNVAMKYLAETNRLITSLAGMIMTDKGNEKDPFWNNSAKNLLEGLIGLFLEEYRKGKLGKEKITLTSIKKFQNSSMDENNFKILFDYIDKKPYGLKSKDSLTSIFASAENTYKSITATFGEKMSLFDDVNVANITSTSDFDFDLLGKEPTAIYIIVPDEDKTYYTLITLIVGLLYRELVKLANSKEEKKLPVQIDWLLDEFANCPPLSDIEAIVSVARSRGMRFQFFIQSFSQLDNVYGKEVAQIILDNCGLVYLKTNTQETAEAISKRLGKKTIESKSISQSVAKLDFNGNRSTSLMGRDLLTPEEVKQLHYKTIIFPTIGFPVFRDTVIYKKFSCYKKGELNRTPNLLKDLSYTYYTVEQINRKINRQKVKEEDNPSENDEIDEFYKEIKESFNEIVNNIKQVLINRKYEIDYPIENGMMYCCIKLDILINTKLENDIQKFNSDLYYIEIVSKDKKTSINVHKKF